MEDFQKRWIIKHLDYLCLNTPNPGFIANVLNNSKLLSAEDARTIIYNLKTTYDKCCKLYSSIIIDNKVSIHYFLRLLCQLEKHSKPFTVLALNEPSFQDRKTTCTFNSTEEKLAVVKYLSFIAENLTASSTSILVYSCSHNIITIEELSNIFFPCIGEKHFDLKYTEVATIE